MAVVLGLFEITGRGAARRRDERAAGLRDELAAARRDALAAEQLADRARQEADAAREHATGLESGAASVGPTATGDRPPAVGRELITIADRLVDLTGDGAPTDPDQAAAALRWIRSRTATLLALCEIAPITDDGALDFMRHEVVGDRPAPSPELVDHIAATVRPGYQWHHDLLRAQQVIAYVPPPVHTGDQEAR